MTNNILYIYIYIIRLSVVLPDTITFHVTIDGWKQSQFLCQLSQL